MAKKILTVVLSIVAALGTIAGAMAILYKVMKKHLKFSVEVLPDDIEDENDLTAAVDVVDIDIPDEKEEASEATDEEIEIAFVEEAAETEEN
ncbi:MAG: hypothetical protein IJX02_02975 [Clostridia bacterium]|nr:hypothetical protein [Clostridia bacterium]